MLKTKNARREPRRPDRTCAPGLERSGSTTVTALMVSMFLIILLMATMGLTMVDASMTHDYIRNVKTQQAAQSGVEHGEVVLAHAISNFNMPAYKKKADITEYATESEGTSAPANLSLLTDTGQYFYPELYQYSTQPDAAATIETGGTGVATVDYSANVDVLPTGVDRPESGDISYHHVFHYDYEVTSAGEAAIGGERNQATRVEQGSFDVDVQRPSFATYGYFTQGMKNQYNDQLVFFEGEVYSGPTHVNSAPPEGRAGFYGSPTFNGPFSAVQSSYEDSWLGGNANPIFNDSVTWGVDPITLPPNGWSQLRAAVGDYSNIEKTSAPAEGWDAYLADWMALPVGTTTLPEGVYYAANAGDESVLNDGTELQGGLLIWGDAQSISLDADGSSQVLTVSMSIDSGGPYNGDHTWVFSDDGSGTMVTMDGGDPQYFNQPLNGMVHINGKVLALQGDGTDGGDVEESHELTISASSDIYIADHITYEADPITTPDATNILGIFSSAGNIWIDRDAPSDLTVHGSVMATGINKGIGAEGLASGGTYDYNYPYKGNWNLLGGLIENKNQTTGVHYSDGHTTGYLWNFTYDERFGGGVAPPYFPYVTKFVMTLTNVETTDWGRKYY